MPPKIKVCRCFWIGEMITSKENTNLGKGGVSGKPITHGEGEKRAVTPEGRNGNAEI